MSEPTPRALALVDGEHYPNVVRDAFAELPYSVVAAVMLGGTEKIKGGEDYGVPMHDSLQAGLDAAAPEVVVDLSDEPVLDAPARFRLASRALAFGVPYVGADFRLDPVAFEPYARPSLAIVGTGKRVGKTAVAGHVARLLARDREVVVVAMGRGGPPDPVVVDVPPTVESLLELARGGKHAASDYLEDAALARVVTVGCRRCGGGLAGEPFVSNVSAGAQVAADREPDLVIFEGSGAALPPVATDARILVVGAAQELHAVAGYLGPYRLLVSDFVVVTGCEEPLASSSQRDAVRQAIDEVDPDLEVVETVLRPKPVEPVEGRRVAFFSTAPEVIHDRLRQHLEEEHGAEVLLVSGNLSRRDALREDLDRAGDADVFLVEIKAAAIDVVADVASERGVDVVFADNAVVATDESLDEKLLALVESRVPA